MKPTPPSGERPPLPEHVVESQHVGWIPAEQLPWLGPGYLESQVGLSLLRYENGQHIYVASAGTAAMNRISKKTRRKEPVGSDGYTRTDKLWLRACYLRAAVNDQDVQANLISTVRSPSTHFAGFTIEAMRAAPSPNTPRVYMARSNINNLRPEMLPGHKVIPDTRLLVRLVTTDKHGQLEAISLLDGSSKGKLRQSGAGGV